LAKWKKSDSNCLSPKGEFWHRLERVLDLSKNVSEPAKNDLGNNQLSFDPTRTIPETLKQHPVKKNIIHLVGSSCPVVAKRAKSEAASED